jgi:hypothetical protein
MSNLKRMIQIIAGGNMHAFLVGDKVKVKVAGSRLQYDNYTEVTKNGRIVKICQIQGQTVASVAWSIGPALSDEFIEDLVFQKG